MVAPFICYDLKNINKVIDPMKSTILLLLILNIAHANNISETHEAKLKKLKDLSYDDLAHEHKGCPENSICSEEMGKKFQNWNAFLKRLQKVKRSNWPKMINKYRTKHGIPFYFLVKQKDATKTKAVFWNSRCRNHNPKDGETILKGLGFFKNRPQAEHITFDVVQRPGIKDKVKTVHLPYGHQPLLIHKNKLIFTMDFEDIYFHMSADENGFWRALAVPSMEISTAMNYIETVQCPKNDFKPNEWHTQLVCKKIWNSDIRKSQMIQLTWSCP
jgi:hypothetical protein